MILAKFDGKIITGAEFSHRDVSDENMCAGGRESYATCPNSGYRVTHISESSDGRVPHFRYCPNTPEYGRVGQTEEHLKLVQESIAASEVTRLLSDVTVTETLIETGGHAAPVSDKNGRQRDVQLEFEDRDPQLGEGLIIEVQVKNKSKDKHLTTADYLAEDSEYSVLWLSDDDFDTSADAPRDWSVKIQTETELRELVKRQISPLKSPDSVWMWRSNKPVPDSVSELRLPKETQPADPVDVDVEYARVPVTLANLSSVALRVKHGLTTISEVATKQVNKHDDYDDLVNSSVEYSRVPVTLANISPVELETKHNLTTLSEIIAQEVGQNNVIYKKIPREHVIIPTSIPEPCENVMAKHDYATPDKLERRGRLRGKIRANPEISTSALGRHFQWSPGIVAQELAKLANDGIITRLEGETSDNKWTFTDDRSIK